MITSSLGNCLKNLRKAKKLTQEYVAGNLISPSTYNKIENDKLKPSYKELVYIFDRLEIAPKEFQEYLSTSDRKSYIFKKFKEIHANIYVDKIEKVIELCKTSLRNEKDLFLHDLLVTCNFLLNLSHIDKATNLKEVEKVWERLSRQSNWYDRDIELIGIIMYAFPRKEHSQLILHRTKKIVENLKQYSKMTDSASDITALLITLSSILIQMNECDLAMSQLTRVIHLSLQSDQVDITAIATVRLGIAQEKKNKGHGSENIVRGFKMLEVLEKPQIVRAMQKEVLTVFSKEEK